MSFCSVFRKVLFKLYVFLVTIIVLTLFLLIFPFLFPIYAYRFLLSKSIRIFRPDLAKILATRCNIFASIDGIYNKPKTPLIVHLRIEGDFQPIQDEREFYLKNLLLLKDKDGNLKRPEFQQYITSWMGFYFWKKDPNFRIENHILDYDGERKSDSYDEAALYQIGVDLASTPFKMKQSPWEFIVCRNCKSVEFPKPYTGMMIRIHHAMADGFAILKFANEIISSERNLEPMQILRPKLTTCQRICQNISFVLKSPFELVESMLTVHDKNAWHIPEEQMSRDVQGRFERISVDFIKEIKNSHSVTFTSVVLAGLAGGVRKFMLQTGVKVPKHIHILTPLPILSHGDKLRNYASLIFAKLPIGTEDPVQRLHMIDEDLYRLRKSSFPLLIHHLSPLLGGLFPCMTRVLSKQFVVTGVVANFPGPQNFVLYNNGQLPILDIFVMGGFFHGNMALGASALSYNGILRLGVGLDETFIPANTAIKNLLDNILQEFDLLKVLGSV